MTDTSFGDWYKVPYLPGVRIRMAAGGLWSDENSYTIMVSLQVNWGDYTKEMTANFTNTTSLLVRDDVARWAWAAIFHALRDFATMTQLYHNPGQFAFAPGFPSDWGEPGDHDFVTVDF